MRDTITFGYDEVGNLASIDRSGTAADMTYGYDLLHGWVKEITSTGGFEQRLYREDNIGHKLYNGSISAMMWKVPDDSYERRYEYAYDGLNRLTEGAYSESLTNPVGPIMNDSLIFPGPHPGIINPLGLIPRLDSLEISINARDRYSERFCYDRNSNITSIERYGMNNQRHYSLIDSLVITRSCNLILKNGQPSMYLFEGGYATFDTNGTVDGWHYYMQDYMGNNRMVVNKNGTVEQITHYYPYGGVIGDISTNESFQNYKFEGKELDRTFGLDNYDIHARQYFAMMPSWDRIDPLSEKYYGISPYAYCGGDPVNFGDYNGMDWYGYNDSIEINGVMTEVYSIRYTEYTSQEELDKNNISGDYLGERVVSILGSYNEVLGKGDIIDGENSIYAKARVYINQEDETSPSEYTAFTMSSNYDLYGAIKDGNYKINYRQWPGSGSIPKHYIIDYPVDCIDDRNYSWYNKLWHTKPFSRTQKNGIAVHCTKEGGKAGGLVSTGCILIDSRQWNNFEQQIGNNGFSLILRRR